MRGEVEGGEKRKRISGTYPLSVGYPAIVAGLNGCSHVWRIPDIDANHMQISSDVRTLGSSLARRPRTWRPAMERNLAGAASSLDIPHIPHVLHQNHEHGGAGTSKPSRYFYFLL